MSISPNADMQDDSFELEDDKVMRTRGSDEGKTFGKDFNLT